MADKSNAPGMDKGKMIKIGIAVVILAIVAWQAMGLFSGGGGSAPDMPQQIVKPNPDIPKQASMAPRQAVQQQEQRPLTEREMQMMRLQQETEAKYIAALNELQILRVEKEIAETQKDINKAKLETITSQKGIVDLLVPPQPERSETDVTKSLETQTKVSSTTGQSTIQSSQQSDASYTVVSVSKLRGKWTAVMSSKGKLYYVTTGDILGPSNEVVMSIDQTGVLLERDGKQRKVSMVPII